MGQHFVFQTTADTKEEVMQGSRKNAFLILFFIFCWLQIQNHKRLLLIRNRVVR